jgi:thioredoxin 1
MNYSQNIKPNKIKNILIVSVLVVAISVFLFSLNPKSEKKGVAMTDASFDKIVFESDNPVMVDFWATWCGPCRMLSPIVEEIESEYKGKLDVIKVDVDQNSGIANRYSISSIPTLLFFKDGKVVDQQIGLISKEELKQKVDVLLEK